MARKLFAGGLLLVVCLGLSLTGRVSSQDTRPAIPAPALSVARDEPANLGQMVQELKNVRTQKAELDRREQQLVELIARKVQEVRQQLDQETQSRRQQLDQIESLLHQEPKRGGSGAKATKTEAKTIDKRGYTEEKK